MLRQGIRREHVAAVVAVCAISDAILIAVGVAGFGAVAAAVPWLVPAMRWMDGRIQALVPAMRCCGPAFSLWSGFQRFQAARKGGEALMPAADKPTPLSKVLLTCVIFTWANPHVYLDTMVLIGSISTHHAPFEVAFGWGAAAASLSFFALLGFGARLLAPLFATPRAWVVLECVVGLTMWVIAATLAFG